jgi:hypothetical protein
MILTALGASLALASSSAYASAHSGVRAPAPAYQGQVCSGTPAPESIGVTPMEEAGWALGTAVSSHHAAKWLDGFTTPGVQGEIRKYPLGSRVAPYAAPRIYNAAKVIGKPIRGFAIASALFSLYRGVPAIGRWVHRKLT